MAITQQLAARGAIEIRPVKGGVMLDLAGEAPKRGPRLGAPGAAATRSSLDAPSEPRAPGSVP